MAKRRPTRTKKPAAAKHARKAKPAKKTARKPAKKAAAKPKKPAAKPAGGPPHEMPPQALLMQGLFGFMVTKGISTIASLDVADALKGGPLYYSDLANVVGADQRALHRTMRMLASVGIFAEPSPGTYANTPVSELLAKDHAGSMRDMAVMITSPSHWLPWGQYEETVRTGESGPQHAFGTDFFSWCQRAENSEQWVIFNAAMTSFSSGIAPLVAEAVDFSRFKRIVDIGGGHGLLLKMVLAKAPKASGILFDLPGVVEGATNLSDRITAQGGDFFGGVPGGADCYVMKHIIHDWSDQHCRTLLGNIAAAMDPSGRVFVIESLMPETPEPHPAKFMDVNMLAMTEGGCERTEKEFAELFQSVGLKLVAVHPTPGPVSVVEAAKA
jgi:hypothetical protein